MYQIQKRLTFLRTMLSDFRVGAITNSSKYVVKQVSDALPYDLSCIVEYGPGSGVMTEVLLQHLVSSGKYLAIEANANFFESLKSIKDTRLALEHGQAQDVKKFVAAHQLGAANVVVSSIPLTLLTKQERYDLFEKTRDLLTPQGTFVIFHQYSTLALKELKQHFREVRVRFERRNVFPCFIFYAKK